MQRSQRRKNVLSILIFIFYFLFILFSFLTDFSPGKEIGKNFFSFFIYMVKILPCAFILIGLFDTWVKKETVEKYLGSGSGIVGYVWAIVLAGTTVGGLYVAFPVAYTLYSKGAKLSVIFTYIGASAICRVPMTVFEASFLGIKFTMIRLFVSLPLLVLSSIVLGNYLEKEGYKIEEGR